MAEAKRVVRMITAALKVKEAGDAETGAMTAALIVRPIGAGEDAAWDAALRRSAGASVFLQSTYLSAAARTLACEVQRIGVFEQGAIVGGLAGIEREGRLERLPLTPYGGVWLTQAEASLPHRAERKKRRHLTALAQAVRARHSSAAIDCDPATTDVRAFSWNGWRAEARYTFVTDLTELFEERFDPDVRRRSRNAERGGVRFERDVPPSEFERLWRMTHARPGLATPLAQGGLARLIEAVRAVIPCGVHGARQADGRLVAGNVVLFGESTAYYWLAGFDPAEAATGGNGLCVVDTLREAARRATRFDWVGANTPSVAEFKQSFGPRLTPYYRLSVGETTRRPERAAMRIVRWLRARQKGAME